MEQSDATQVQGPQPSQPQQPQPPPQLMDFASQPLQPSQPRSYAHTARGAYGGGSGSGGGAAPRSAAASHTASTASLVPPYPYPPVALASLTFPPSLLSNSPSTVSLPRGQLSLRERVELHNLQVHHAHLRHAAPTLTSGGRDEADAALQLHLQANHVATMARVANMRAEEIARKNAALVGKITRTVMGAASPYSQDSITQTPYKSSRHSRPFVHRSLNLGRRRAEQARIASENLVLARRIIERRPRIADKGEWDQHANKHDKIMRTISRFIEMPIGTPQQPQLSPMQLYAQQQQPAHFSSLPQTNIPLPPGGLPPGYSMESYIQQMYMQQQQMQQLAQQQQQQYQQQPQQSLSQQPYPHPHPPPPAAAAGFSPSPPTYARARSTASSRPSSAGAASVAGAAGAGGGPLAPLPGAQKRSARLQKKLLAVEKDKFAPSATSQTTHTTHAHAALI